MKKIYHPRHDFCLVRIKAVGESEGGVHLPVSSAAGKEFVIVSVGPEVVGLKKGDKVIIVARAGEGDYYPMPRDPDLIAVKEKYLAFTVQEIKED